MKKENASENPCHNSAKIKIMEKPKMFLSNEYVYCIYHITDIYCIPRIVYHRICFGNIRGIKDETVF